MNRLSAIVTRIEGEQNLHIISFDFQGVPLSMMGLDLPFGLEIGSHVILGAKPSHIAIAKELQGVLSYSNQLEAKILRIENGTLLCSILLHVKGIALQSFITRRSSERMGLVEGENVTVLIKASELFVLEVLDV
ncbi:MAG: TOBE domain-containing protein [Sulfurospirillaceae bacterium]|jgi:molybdopterin-binding protein|nr:TOBE domain-containing protein [Sulfurospirillaceae bacterium]MDD2826406.1 TOBE domain-containing protein [Sulfurospirillaceae bacterium]